MSAVHQAFETHELVADLILESAPITLIEVTYGSEKVDLGNTLTPTQVKDLPTTVSWPAEPDSRYTLVFTGNDCDQIFCILTIYVAAKKND